MTDQELDALMKRVLIDSIRLDLDEVTKNDTIQFTPSARHQRQMSSMLEDPLKWLRKKSRPIWKAVVQKVAMILLVISIGFGAVMVTSPTARAAFVRWITEWYETHVTYRYTGEGVSGTMPQYEITELPEGYYEFERKETSNYTQVIYQNADNDKRIRLNYIYMQQGSATDFYVEDLEIVSITVRGMDGGLYLSKNLATGDNTVTWIDEDANLQFTVDAPFEQEKILRIAESVIEKNTEDKFFKN